MNIRTILLLALCSPLSATLLPAATSSHPTPAAIAAAPHPFFCDEVYPAWTRMTPRQAVTDIRAALAESKERLQTLLSVTPEEATFENTFLAWEAAEEHLRQVQSCMYHLTNSAGTPELQQAMGHIIREVAESQANRPELPRIWQLLNTAASAPWVQELSPAKQRYIRKVLLELQMAGAGLPPEQLARKAAIEQELKYLGFQFNENIQSEDSDWQLLITDPAELAGMPERWMKQAAEAAAARGLATADTPAWLITPHNAAAVLSRCTVPETRRCCWPGTCTTATAQGKDNEPVIYRIMELRHELATLLGFRHFADMQAATRMTGSAEKALAFVDDMLQKSKPAYDAWTAAQMERFSKAAGRPLSTLNPWDERILSRHLPAQKSGFDASVLTPYFEAENVIQGMLKLWAGLLGVTYTELPTACPAENTPCPADKVEVWHPEVRCFAVHDTATGTHLGSFYMDLYPRKGKRGMAWSMPLRAGKPNPDGSVGEPNLATLQANLTSPRPGQPHLFNHGDLYVLFHEFGHISHMILGHGEVRSQAAIGVEHDFIETPSQLQESWIWEPEALATFARHHETGAPIPPDLLQQLADSRKESPIDMHMRMLCASKLDLELNMFFHEKFKGKPLDTVASELLRPWQFPYSVPVPTEMRTLTHCISEGYAASLYTYKWSEALAADAFSRFQQEGVLNPATGAAYRKTILDPGSSKPAAQLFRDFMGRDPDPTPLLNRFRAD